MFSHHFPQPLVLRVWLHGEFQPGLKFRSAHRAEILLRLHGQFQPGRKTQISVRKFTEVRKHNRCACSRSFFSPGWKNDSDYMDFSARLAGLKILARFENTGLGFSARAELRPGLNPSPCNRKLGFQRICFRSRSEISARGETHHVIGPLVRYVWSPTCCVTLSELSFGETIGDTADLQTIIYHFSRFWVCCVLSKRISSLS